MHRYCFNCGAPATFKDKRTSWWFCDGPRCKADLADAHKFLRRYQIRRTVNLLFSVAIPILIIAGAAILTAAVLQKLGIADFSGIF